MDDERRDSVGKRIGKRAFPKPGDGRGAPAHVPTEYLKGLATGFFAAGYSIKDVAEKVGLAEATLRKHYAHQLETAARDTEALALKGVIGKVKDGDLGACKWWLQTRTNQFNLTQEVAFVPAGDPEDHAKTAEEMQREFVKAHESKQ